MCLIVGEEVFYPGMVIMCIPTEDRINTTSGPKTDTVPGITLTPAADPADAAAVAPAPVPAPALAQVVDGPVAAKKTPMIIPQIDFDTIKSRTPKGVLLFIGGDGGYSPTA